MLCIKNPYPEIYPVSLEIPDEKCICNLEPREKFDITLNGDYIIYTCTAKGEHNCSCSYNNIRLALSRSFGCMCDCEHVHDTDNICKAPPDRHKCICCMNDPDGEYKKCLAPEGTHQCNCSNCDMPESTVVKKTVAAAATVSVAASARSLDLSANSTERECNCALEPCDKYDDKCPAEGDHYCSCYYSTRCLAPEGTHDCVCGYESVYDTCEVCQALPEKHKCICRVVDPEGPYTKCLAPEGTHKCICCMVNPDDPHKKCLAPEGTHQCNCKLPRCTVVKKTIAVAATKVVAAAVVATVDDYDGCLCDVEMGWDFVCPGRKTDGKHRCACRSACYVCLALDDHHCVCDLCKDVYASEVCKASTNSHICICCKLNSEDPKDVCMAPEGTHQCMCHRHGCTVVKSALRM
jgi:hypothetical protein